VDNRLAKRKDLNLNLGVSTRDDLFISLEQPSINLRAIFESMKVLFKDKSYSKVFRLKIVNSEIRIDVSTNILCSFYVGKATTEEDLNITVMYEDISHLFKGDKTSICITSNFVEFTSKGAEFKLPLTVSSIQEMPDVPKHFTDIEVATFNDSVRKLTSMTAISGDYKTHNSIYCTRDVTSVRYPTVIVEYLNSPFPCILSYNTAKFLAYMFKTLSGSVSININNSHITIMLSNTLIFIPNLKPDNEFSIQDADKVKQIAKVDTTILFNALDDIIKSVGKSMCVMLFQENLIYIEAQNQKISINVPIPCLCDCILSVKICTEYLHDILKNCKESEVSIGLWENLFTMQTSGMRAKLSCISSQTELT